MAAWIKSSVATYSLFSFKKFDHSTRPLYHILKFLNLWQLLSPTSQLKWILLRNSITISRFSLSFLFLLPIAPRIPSSFITFSLHLFSSCFCFNFLLVLPRLSLFDLGSLFLSSQVPYGFIVFLLLSVCEPDMTFLFFNCTHTFSTLPASALTIVPVNSRLQP